jgi:hypothetical protein
MKVQNMAEFTGNQHSGLDCGWLQETRLAPEEYAALF